MKQVLCVGSSDNLSTGTTLYANLFRFVSWGTTENVQEAVMPTAGTFRNLTVKLSGTPGSGKSYAFTVRKNGADQALTTTVNDAETTDKDVSNSFTVAAGDRVSLKCVPSGTPTAVSALYSVEFEPSTSAYNVLSGFPPGSFSTAIRIFHSADGTSNDADQARVYIPHSCTVRSIYADLTVAPGAGNSRTISIFKNGSDEASSQVLISDTATTGNATGLSIALSRGDYIQFSTIGSGTPASTRARIALALEAGTDGESIVANQYPGSPSTSVENYHSISSVANDAFSGTEADFLALAGVTSFDLKNLYVRIVTAPGATKTWAFKVRKNSANGSLVADLVDPNTTAGDVTNTDSFAEGDTIGISTSSLNTPASAGRTSWTLTQYIAPDTPPPPTPVPHKMTLLGV